MDVEGGSADASVLQSLCQCGFIDQASARRVDEESAGPHLFDRVLVDQVMVVFVQSAVERHTVRLEQQILPTQKPQRQSIQGSHLDPLAPPRPKHHQMFLQNLVEQTRDATHLEGVDTRETQGSFDTVR